MEAPLGEKASPLKKDKASRASKDWSLCPLELIQALLELLHAPLELRHAPLELLHAPLKLLHAPLQLIWAPLELPKALTMPFFLKMLKYAIFVAKL